jgi:general secretion pathway protein A
MIDGSLDKRGRTRPSADDPRFAASVSALDHGLHDEALDVFGSPQTPTIESFSGDMLADVAAEWRDVAADDRSPRRNALFRSAEHDRVLNELVTSVTRGDAVIVLTGEHAVGKTTVCRALVEHLDRRILVSFLGPTSSADYLLKTLLVDFGVISDHETARRRLGSTSRDDLFRALDNFLSSLTVLQASALVIVDDAHALPADVLSELRALCQEADRRLLQIVLVGEPVLTRRLRKDDLRSLDDRVATRVTLGPLAPAETPEYVAYRLAMIGKGERVQVDDDALREMFAFSDGLPGVVNQICDRAAAMGVQLRGGHVDGAIVAHAAHALGIERRRRSAALRSRALTTAVVLLMLAAGAAVAGWVFRQPLSRAMSLWHGGDPSTSSTAK